MPFEHELMRERRLFLHMTQPELARLAGLYDASELSKIERGKVIPGAQVVANIAWALSWPMERLVTPNDAKGIDRSEPRKLREYSYTMGDARMEPQLRGKGGRRSRAAPPDDKKYYKRRNRQDAIPKDEKPAGEGGEAS